MIEYYSRLMDRDDEVKLQQLLESCADYFELVYGLPVGANEADELFRALPEAKTFDDKFIVGIFNQENIMIGVIDIIRDYPVESSWCLGLMLLAPEARGQGIGRKIYDDTEEWAFDLGARIIRLGVVAQNVKGLKFWKTMGFKEISRINEKHGNKENTLIVMTRSLLSE